MHTTIFSERYLNRYASELKPYAEKIGIPPEFFSRHDVEISVKSYAELLDLGAQHIDPLIGFDIGRHLQLEQLGPLGYAARSAANVRDLLLVMSKYLYIFSHTNSAQLAIGKNSSMLSYRFPVRNPSHRRHDTDLALAAFVNFIRTCTGTNFTPHFVELSHQYKDKRYAEYFGCEIRRGSSGNRLHFASSELERPLLTNDPSLLQALTTHLDQQLILRDTDVGVWDKLLHLIPVAISRGRTNIQDVASELGASVRTLQRHLRRNNLVYSDLLDDCRLKLANEYMSTTDYSLTDIALMLGYSELSTFSRAYHRWTGEWPQDMRKALAVPTTMAEAKIPPRGDISDTNPGSLV